jgi:hypothetical protein
MTHLHYLIICGSAPYGKSSILDETATIYTVSVGTSKQANSDYLFLTAFAADHDCYFALRSKESIDFVFRLIQEYRIPQAQQISIDARSLVRAIKAGVKAPNEGTKNTFQHQFRKIIDLNYRISCNLAAAKIHLHSGLRKKPNAL